jgi:putative sterol carrier protein
LEDDMPRKPYAKLVPLVKNPAGVKDPKDLDLDEVAKFVAKSFEQSRDQGSFEYYVLDDSQAMPFRLELRGGKPVISKEATGKANFALRASRATAAELAKGELSPVDAYLSGKLEVLGDLDFAKRLYARLAAKNGETEF